MSGPVRNFRKAGRVYQQRQRNYTPDFRAYEREKYAWIAHHPRATGEEYVAAIREIAERCGI